MSKQQRTNRPGDEPRSHAVYIVGERGGAAQFVEPDGPRTPLLAEAAALVHALADQVEALKRKLRC